MSVIVVSYVHVIVLVVCLMCVYLHDLVYHAKTNLSLIRLYIESKEKKSIMFCLSFGVMCVCLGVCVSVCAEYYSYVVYMNERNGVKMVTINLDATFLL